MNCSCDKRGEIHQRKSFPEIRAAKGKILNVASTAAFVPGPGLTVYYASKAFVLSFSDALHFELKGEGVVVSALCPGPTSTEIWPTGATPTLPMRPEDVAEVALRKLGRRTTAVAGLLNRLITLSTRFAPRWLNSVIFGRVVGGMFQNVRADGGAVKRFVTTDRKTSAATN